MRQFLHKRMAGWALRRQGLDQLPLILRRGRIYILPTRAGMGFGLLLVLMLIGGLNYGNSLALFLTFLLIGFTLVVMHRCHRNLLGIGVISAATVPATTSRGGAIRLTLANVCVLPREAIHVSVAVNGQHTEELTDLLPQDERCLEIALPHTGTKALRIERLTFYTLHPFALFRAWTWLHLPLEVATESAPRESPEDADPEWFGLRAFRDGDSPRQVAWSAYARGAPLLVKEYRATPLIKSSAGETSFPAEDVQPRKAPVPPLAAPALAWTLAAFLSGVLLHVDRVPVWASLAALFCGAWRLSAAASLSRMPPRFPLPGRVLQALLALTLTGAVLLGFRTLNGLAAGTALLVAMGAIKLLETHRQRDLQVIIGAALFLLIAACLDRQHLTRAPFYVLQVWLCCTALGVTSSIEQRSQFNTAPETQARDVTKLAGQSLLYALPLALLLFVFFPRLPGSFWALPASQEAVTGLSDEMSPGSISSLSESYTPAFRVWFEGAPPPPQERYWRGPVLHDFDGYTWRRSRGRVYRQEALEYLGRPYRHRIALEPHSGVWWFALDTVRESPRRTVFLTYDRQLVSLEPISQTTHYDALSYTRTRALEPLSSLARRYDTALPADRNPRSITFAQRLRAQTGTDEEYVRALMQHFRSGGFEYTLTPPLLNLNSVDDFLFNTRRGFCGHFASAFVALMRAAGIPARVVTGYLGGEWNPIGRYFIVHQSDAHAWAEVWLEGRGWTRFDPTSVVAPGRLQRGLFDMLPGVASAPRRFMRASPWLTEAAHTWDAVNTWWADQVVKFDFKSQLRLLERLGFTVPDWRPLGWLLALGLTAWLAFMGLRFGRAPRTMRPDALGRAYLILCRKLARAGLPRQAHQGPLDYLHAIERQSPAIARSVEPLLEKYTRLRYGALASAKPRANPARVEQDVAFFKRAVTRLSLNAKDSPRAEKPPQERS